MAISTNIVNLSEFLKSPEEAKKIKQVARSFKSDVVDVFENKVKSSLSKKIFLDLKIAKTRALKKGQLLTEEELNAQVYKKNKGAKDWYIKRILNTESHSQNEAVKNIDSRLKGYSRKKWVSQRDGIVRTNHKEMNSRNEFIGIDEEFVLPNGKKGMYPGAKSLGANEVINCRCFVVYDKPKLAKVKQKPTPIAKPVQPKEIKQNGFVFSIPTNNEKRVASLKAIFKANNIKDTIPNKVSKAQYQEILESKITKSRDLKALVEKKVVKPKKKTKVSEVKIPLQTKGADSEVVEIIESALQDLTNEHPILNNVISEIKVTGLKNKPLGQNIFGMKVDKKDGGYVAEDNIIQLNIKKYSKEQYKQKIKENFELKHSSTNNEKHLIYHESAHAFDNYYSLIKNKKLKQWEELKKQVKDKSMTANTVVKDYNDIMRTSIIKNRFSEDVMKKVTNEMGFKNFKEMANTSISKYGSLNESEGFAELFAKSMNKDKDEVTKVFDKILKESIGELDV